MAPQLPFRMPNLGPRTRRVLRYAGFAVFALVVFVFAFQMSFPFDRVKDKVTEALSEKYDVTIASVERGWMPGRVYFNHVSLRTRKTKPTDKITVFNIKQLEVDLGVLSLIGGTIAVDIEAKIGNGELVGEVAIGGMGRGDIEASFKGKNLDGQHLPMYPIIGLPMPGILEFSLDLELPVEKAKTGKTAIDWQRAAGAFSIACPKGCTFGDGETKLKPLLKNTRNQAMVGEGIDFGKVHFDKLVAKATMKDGRLTLDRFDTASQDGELHIDFMMTLDKKLGNSVVAGCLRFKGSDDLLKREPKTYAALQTTGAELREDGLFHIRLTGEFDKMKKLNQACGPTTKINNDENFDRKPERPSLTVQPTEPATPTPPAPTPMDDAARNTAETPPTPSPTPAPPPAAGSGSNVAPAGSGSGSNGSNGADGANDGDDHDEEGADGAANASGQPGEPPDDDAREIPGQQEPREFPEATPATPPLE